MKEQGTDGGWAGEEAGWAAAYAAITAELAFEPDEGSGVRGRMPARSVISAPAATVNMNRVIESALPLLHCLLGPGIDVTVDLAPGPLPIAARAPRVEQLVLALAGSAREAMRGGGRFTLRTRSLHYTASPASRVTGRYAVLSVEDSGPAASEEERARLSPRADLLLASVRGIVEECGGWMQVSARAERGIEYRIHFLSGEPA
jgi:signal transduction histidine kinase